MLPWRPGEAEYSALKTLTLYFSWRTQKPCSPLPPPCTACHDREKYRGARLDQGLNDFFLKSLNMSIGEVSMIG